jgi:hypothetical protein
MSTTDTTTSVPPAGWYPDPTGRHERRWWDGTAWTHEVADPAAPGEQGEVLEGVGAAEAEPVAEAAEVQPATPAEAEGEPEPEPERFDAEPVRLRPEQRASTGAGLSTAPSRRNLVLGIVGAVVVLASLLWGYENYSTADKWRDRGEQLQARLDDTSSNANAVEDALSNSASRRAQMEDSFQSVGELREATVATMGQLNDCINILNGLLNTIAANGDPAPGIDQANQVCGAAGMNGATLIQILEELEEG